MMSEMGCLRRDFLFQCAEEVKGEVRLCRFCGFEFLEQDVLPTKEMIEKRFDRTLSASSSFLSSSKTEYICCQNEQCGSTPQLKCYGEIK